MANNIESSEDLSFKNLSLIKCDARKKTSFILGKKFVKNDCPSTQVRSEENESEEPKKVTLTDLPLELVVYILEYLSFEDKAKLRQVSLYFNKLCSDLLNKEFKRLRTAVQNRFLSLKAQMPRRESSRRKHPLARESDIMETLYMRLTLLNMTFGKHIEREYCCFFAGEILDEIHKILRYVANTPSLSRAYKVTDELFDLSTMAMEYFKEHIEPRLPEVTYFASEVFEHPAFHSPSKAQLAALAETVTASTSQTPSRSPNNSIQVLSKRMKLVKDLAKKNRKDIASIKRSVKHVTKRVGALEEVIQQLKWQQKNSEGSALPDSHKINEILVQLNMYKHEIDVLTAKLSASQSTNSNAIFEVESSEVKKSSACSHSDGSRNVSEPSNLCGGSPQLGPDAGISGERELLTSAKCSVSQVSPETVKKLYATSSVATERDRSPDRKRLCIDLTLSSDNEE